MKKYTIEGLNKLIQAYGFENKKVIASARELEREENKK